MSLPSPYWQSANGRFTLCCTACFTILQRFRLHTV